LLGSPFSEYLNGDPGAGLGASHQTGWIALVALLLWLGGATSGPRPTPRSAAAHEVIA
jgi:hypothetical protein